MVLSLESTGTVLKSLVHSLRSIFTIMLFGLLLLGSYSCFGVALFKGRLRRCFWPSSMGDPDQLGDPTGYNYDECLAKGGVWHNPPDMGNFDNFGSAFLMVYELAGQARTETPMNDHTRIKPKPT